MAKHINLTGTDAQLHVETPISSRSISPELIDVIIAEDELSPDDLVEVKIGFANASDAALSISFAPFFKPKAIVDRQSHQSADNSITSSII